MENTAADYETSVLKEVTGHHMEAVASGNHWVSRPGLVGPRPPRAAIANAIATLFGTTDIGNILVSQVARISILERIAKGDLVLVGQAGQACFGFVEFLFDRAAMPSMCTGMAILEICEVREVRARTFLLRKSVGSMVCIHLHDIQCSLVWVPMGTELEAIKPDHLQTQSG